MLHLRKKGGTASKKGEVKMGSIFVSEEACRPLLDALEATGHTVYTVKASDVVYRSISSHPDIYMCRIKNVLVIDDAMKTEPDIRQIYMEAMEEKADDFTETPLIPALYPGETGACIVFEMGGIGPEYPFDIPYNAATTGRFFLHNTKWTSPSLLDRARNAGLEIIHVKQGYTKCSCITAGENAVITADQGIIRAVEAYNEMLRQENLQERIQEDIPVDLLAVQPGHVALKGFDYGFLGGASGCVDDTVYFNGDLSAHPDFERIQSFLQKHGYRTVFFEGEPLTDIGSVIYLP